MSGPDEWTRCSARTRPDADYKAKVVAVNRLIYNVSLTVLRGVDEIVEQEAAQRRFPGATEQPAGVRRLSCVLMKIYRAEFSR